MDKNLSMYVYISFGHYKPATGSPLLIYIAKNSSLHFVFNRGINEYQAAGKSAREGGGQKRCNDWVGSHLGWRKERENSILDASDVSEF